MAIFVTADIPSDSTLEQEVDFDIEAFERWFCTKVDASATILSGPERAIIKTYLWHKTHPNDVSNG
jgi:hypothetical protein